MVGVVDRAGEEVATELMLAGFPVPAGPSIVTSISQDVNVWGYRHDILEFDCSPR